MCLRSDVNDVLAAVTYALDRDPVWNALQATAKHRGRETRPLGPLLVALRESRQQPWAAYRARVGLPGLPELYADVVDLVVDFLDGLYANRGAHWEPTKRRWE
jgi:hypothetical protein